ncbi:MULTISPECIES: hypothetical protein [unclassified Streptomyces]|uniref:hypothetical protein n=1 Tax=unclassified Streptomyces TaxID=2593676 RepID=UPI0036FC9018
MDHTIKAGDPQAVGLPDRHSINAHQSAALPAGRLNGHNPRRFHADQVHLGPLLGEVDPAQVVAEQGHQLVCRLRQMPCDLDCTPGVDFAVQRGQQTRQR